MNSTTQFLTAAVASANTAAFSTFGKRVHVYAEGTWASSTIKLQFSPDGGTTWLDSGVSLSSATKLGSALAGDGVLARLSLTASGTTSLNAWVPAGFETDYASVPRVFWSIYPPDGTYTEAAVIHDYLYATQTTTRDEADKAFLEGMEALGVPWHRRHILHKAVRSGGWVAWSRNQKANPHESPSPASPPVPRRVRHNPRFN